MNGLFRSATGQILLRSGLHKSFMRNTAVITAFHRIENQQQLDAITIREKDFDSFCRYARRHFNVLTLTELLRRMACGEPISSSMVITFDDGYEDNYLVAAKLLLEHGLPATFFVATDFIGTTHQPGWDRDNGIVTRWMSWSQVKELYAMGFEIGAHTRTHADLGALSLEAAVEEVRGSKLMLEDALGADVTLFSYPFGGKHQCTDDVRQAISSMGLMCCLSCYGGVVRVGDDPFRLKRTPINRWYTDYWHFGAELVNDCREKV